MRKFQLPIWFFTLFRNEVRNSIIYESLQRKLYRQNLRRYFRRRFCLYSKKSLWGSFNFRLNFFTLFRNRVRNSILYESLQRKLCRQNLRRHFRRRFCLYSQKKYLHSINLIIFNLFVQINLKNLLLYFWNPHFWLKIHPSKLQIDFFSHFVK